MWTIKHICVAIRRSDRICIATGLVEETLRRIGARDADFLLCKAMPSDTDIIHALESNGFLLMDTLLNFVFDCRAGRSNDRPQQMPEGFVLRLATSSDVELLAQVAHSSFAGHFGRFHADPRIGHAAVLVGAGPRSSARTRGRVGGVGGDRKQRRGQRGDGEMP